MTHFRERFLLHKIKKALSWMPSIGLLGMRQTGKTTLLKQLGNTYFSFDTQSVVRLFEESASSILGSGPHPIILDEIQKAPFVFDEIKAAIDQTKRPGQFLLTGSVRFSSKKNIRESLTGRTVSFELLPFSIEESYHRPLKNFLEVVTKDNLEKSLKKLSQQDHPTERELQNYLATGGLPGICFRRDETIRKRLLEEHLDTLLGRDIQMLLKTEVSISTLRQLFELICAKQGEPVNLSELSRQVRLSSPTVKNLLQAFEGLFLIRRLGKSIYVEDIGLWNQCCPLKTAPGTMKLKALIYSELKTQLNYHHDSIRTLGEYRSESGSSIPFIISLKEKNTVFITVDDLEYPSKQSLIGLKWAEKKQKEKSILIALHRGDRGVVLNERILSIPYQWVF